MKFKSDEIQIAGEYNQNISELLSNQHIIFSDNGDALKIIILVGTHDNDE